VEAFAMTATLHQQMPLSSGSGSALSELLHRHFGFAAFRANQEEVCRAAIDGHDVLLVMPTGAGKSLCYQLPAIALGGTTLVVSPLIALMEDQVAKLAGKGLRVARIHSGRDRGDSRQACVDYLNGALQFLFIAPERLRVPGFAEMLARRKPSLIAIDEAHCISAWGHDFRRDYRTLGQHLPALRPAPVIALTATATPLVQDDIARQLGMPAAARFIHGFRRENLAIEVVETPKPRRSELTRELLSDPSRRPAIVYAPSRKEAESLAVELSPLFSAAAYHAGLDAQHRDRVQQAFLNGELQAVVATIAFGMGIDKADVRTVIHTAMPATLESFYQEIGRAGRDGKPSRTVLMYSWADRRLLEFFLERDYPSAETLREILRRLPPAGMRKEELRESLGMDVETFERALEKLAVHGGVNVDYSDHVAAGGRSWGDAYSAQIARRQAQIDQVMQYAGGNQCRMAALVRHFGDREDGRRPCGQCDFCSPEGCIAQRFRAPTAAEQQAMAAAMKALRSGQSISTGQLYKQLFPREQMGRNDFEVVLGVLAAAGLAAIEDAVFEKEGREINFRKVRATTDSENLDQGLLARLMVKDGFDPPLARAGLKKRALAVATERSGPSTEDVAVQEAELTGRAGELWEKLRAWRLEEAKKLGVRAFHILGNKTLRAVAIQEPRTLKELLAVSGIGPEKAEKFGEAICRVCSE
jgi:ATP-dependent DNA helicase RecQ